ncbi:MAG TPA: hypothetical protein VH877_22020, partial [Polyangia bacterium]|nr:hypothetical protein [Polyangia bacterium]
IVAPYELVIGPGRKVRAELLLKNFGAANGMLIFTSYAPVEPYEDEIPALGYGFSVLLGHAEEGGYDRQSFIDMLSDWGWAGPEAERPDWLAGDI